VGFKFQCPFFAGATKSPNWGYLKLFNRSTPNFTWHDSCIVLQYIKISADRPKFPWWPQNSRRWKKKQKKTQTYKLRNEEIPNIRNFFLTLIRSENIEILHNFVSLTGDITMMTLSLRISESWEKTWGIVNHEFFLVQELWFRNVLRITDERNR